MNNSPSFPTVNLNDSCEFILAKLIRYGGKDEVCNYKVLIMHPVGEKDKRIIAELQFQQKQRRMSQAIGNVCH